ncbi:MAG: hypothetical protein QOI42_1379, partial [Frankiaceae bacterium]|nr:hypothetical protein [Frankiaceae bacterium]
MGVNTPRSYSSPLRAAQAQETRRRILDSARFLFAGNGYPTTTIAAIARHAGVSADTVYGAFGTKAHLLKQLLDAV